MFSLKILKRKKVCHWSPEI